jgi:indole-3-glycerol phosphate synthase
LCPPDRFLVSESGIKVTADIQKLRGVCVQGFLVGESLLRAGDVTEAVKTLLGR